MNRDNRSAIVPKGGLLWLDNAFVEEIFMQNPTGYLIVSYAVAGANGMTRIELLRLNISRKTVILNERGMPMCLCDVHRGMWISAMFSPRMTRSIPPQSNASFIMVRRSPHLASSVTTDRILSVDTGNNLLNTGNPNDSSQQMRFVITNSTVISDRNGRRISLRSLRPGQRVMVTHANFQTASIPPQTTAFYVQLL